jgi:hypothetical protein
LLHVSRCHVRRHEGSAIGVPLDNSGETTGVSEREAEAKLQPAESGT